MFQTFQEMLAQLEAPVLLFIQNYMRNPALTPVMKGLSYLGNAGIFWIILTVILLAFKKTRKAGLCSAFALLCSLLLNNVILKPLFDRTRPYEMIESLELIMGRASDASFPSGHSAASFASAVAVSKNISRRYGIILIILASLIAFSRLYVGIHFPTDVICGILSGILCGFIGYKTGTAILEKMQTCGGH